MKPATAVFLASILLATAALAFVSQSHADPLAQYRAPDGSLHIPGRALTPELQHLLFGGDDLQPFYNFSYYAPAPSPYPTMQLVERGYQEPNPNVFAHPTQEPETLAGALAHLVGRWFPPVDWGAQVRAAVGWFFGLFTLNARAAVVVDSTTVTDVSASANTCTTSQTAAAADNAILVMLSERATNAFLSVTYGSVSLTLIASTAQNGGIVVRTEIWGFAGALPGGVQTMTATLSGGNPSRMTCATILLQGVKSTGSFINGTSNTASSTNATITLSATVASGNLGFAVAALQNTGGPGVQPTAVSGTGATATDLYGVATGHCTGGGAANECAAGADIPNPGTAITWTSAATTWVVSAVEVVATPTCGSVGGGNCYRIGAGGAWNSATNWSNSPGGASCGCTPLATDIAIFDASPTGTTTLAAATTIAAIDMTGFTGTLDTTATNWALTVNGPYTIQGTFLPRGSTITVSGNVTVLGAATVVTMGSSSWTVNGTWTNNSTSASWSAGTSTVTIKDGASGTLTFANLGVNEFNNLTLDASVAAGLTYTMATNGLRMGGTLTIQNSTAGATGSNILDTSSSNLAVTAGALTVSTWGAFNTEASTITINGNVNISAATGFVTNTGGGWTVTGSWTDASTSASWSFAAAMNFRAPASRTMTFGAQAGNEFSGAVTFDTTVTTAVTYTMATNPLDVGGVITVQNSTVGATGAVTLDTSAGNLGVTAGGLTQSTLGAFNTRASTITINGDVSVSATSAYVTNTGGSWTVSGAWTDRTTSASWSFAAAMTFRAATSKTMTFTGSNIAGNEFGAAVTFDTTATAGVIYTVAAGATGDASLKIGGALTIRNSAGGATAATILDTSAGNYNITATSLTLGSPRGALRSEGSAITINGAVNVSDSNSYLVLGSAMWTVTGSWTDNSTDSVDWSTGTGTLTFRDGANATMTFANLGVNELNNVVFDTPAAAGISYTMATNGLRVAGTVTIQNTAATPTGNVVLTTSLSNLALTASGIVIGTRGTLTANGSTITVNGSWTSTAANHVWNKGTSTVVFGATGTLTMGAGESFNILTQSAGTTTLGSNLTVSGATTINGTLDSSASNFALILQSTLSIGATGVLNLEASTASTAGNVTIAAGGAVRFTGAGTWTINGTWTDNNALAPASWAVSTSTVRIVGAAAGTLTFWTAAGANEFNNLTLDSSVAVGFTYTQANALQTAGTLTVQNTAGGATGTVILDATASNFNSTLGGLVLGALGAYASRGAVATLNGNVSIAASAYITSAAIGTWTATGTWTNGTTSGLWSFAAPITFKSAASQTMTFKATGTEFGGAVTFDTTSAAGVTYTLATNGLTLAGLLTIQNSVASPTGNAVLDTSTANFGITAGSVTIGTNGTLRAQGSTISVGGNWTVTAANATFTAGTSTVVFTATASVNMTQAFNNLTISAGTSTLAANTTVNATLTVSGGTLAKGTFTLSTTTLNLSGGALTSTSGAGTVTGNATISSPASYVSFGSETWTLAGTWSNASTSASWSAGTGTVVFRDGSAATMTFAGTNLAGNEFNNVTFDTTAMAGVTYTMSTRGLRVGGVLTVQNSSAGATGATILDTSVSNLAVTAVALALSTLGAFNAEGSTVTINGNVNVSASSAYLVLGTSTWTVTGSWTNASTSGSWSAGTSTVTIKDGASTTLTFANLGINEFNNLTLDTSAAAGITYTMAVNGLRIGGTLQIQNSVASPTGNAVLVTSNFPVTAGAVTVGTNGTLSAGASTVSLSNVTMTGGTSSAIVLTSGAWTVSGNWDTPGAGSTLSAGTSTVTFTGSSTTINVAPGQMFYDLVISGTVSFSSSVTASAILTVTNGAVLTKTGQTIAFNGLAEIGTGTITDGAVTVVNFTVTNSDAANLTTISAFTLWTVDSEYTWADSSTVATSTLTFTIGRNSLGGRFVVTKDGASFSNGLVDGLGQVVFTMLGSDPVVDVVVTAPCGGTRYWVGGAGNWSQSARWSSTSGGAGGCPVPTAVITVIFDAASGGGTVTVDQNAGMASLNTTGWTGTIAIGAFNFTVNGNLTHAAGTVTIGASSGTGLTITGNLTVSGSAVVDGSGAASVVNVAGNTVIASATAYFRMGSGTWTFSGSWSNASTSGSWAPGTGTVAFNSATSQTMTFANLAADEFHNVTFASTANTGTVTFTMGANPLKWTNTLTIQDTSGSTTTLATANLALLGGSLVVGNSGTLMANGSTAAILDVTMNGGTSGAIVLTSGAWTVSGNWDSSGAGSTFMKGTGSVTLSGSTRTVRIRDSSNGFYNLTVSGTITESSAIEVSSTLSITGTLTTSGNSITGGANLTISGGGTLNGSTSSISVANVTMNDASTNMLSLTSGSLSSSGSWDTSGPASVFVSGTSMVTLTGTSMTITLGASETFATLVVSGTLALGSPLTASSLTVSSGGLTKNGFPLTVSGDLVLSGGYLSSVSGTVTIAGSVDVSSPSSYIAFGSEGWTVSGSWTNASTSASWSAGSATVTFNANSPQTMTFAGTNLSGSEFNAVVFDSGPSTVTFTIAGSGLAAQTITVRGGLGTTTLDTSSSSGAITADTVTVASGGALAANASVITVRSMDTSAGTFTADTSVVVVNASGGSVQIPQVLSSLTVNPGVTTTFASNIRWSAMLTLASVTASFTGSLTSVGPATLGFASATILIAGSWDTSSAVALAASGSTVTFAGSGQTIALGAGQKFATLIVAGSVALASDLAATSLTVNASSTLTKTNHSITFNALAVNGTIADGSLNVSDLTVTNSDVTALVTISLFSTWSVGSSYAWTHSSSEASQTITWAIGGNTPGYLYHVTKDGAAFTNGTVDGSGQVIFTMLGSDPAMQVSMGPPAVLAWWQTPYLLAIPPIGFFMVVAMFAQRRRWRPAKAFLVDEHGQLLREFTLDPSCQVTYEQACQAGALDAQEKDVKVSKYHARTVVGDALAVVLLAYGPVNLQEVEFAREILANIQDKFEDRVKTRLEEARAAEATFEDRTQVLQEGEADLQARSRVFGDMVNALTIARGKLNAEAASLGTREVDLASRETRLGQDRASLDELDRQLESQRSSVVERVSAVEEREADAARTAETLSAREEALTPRERSLFQRESDLEQTESSLRDEEATLAAAQSSLAADTQALQARSEELGRQDEDLADERRALDDLTSEYVAERKALDAKQTELGARETQLADRLQEIEARESSLTPKEAVLSKRDSDLSAKETAFQTKSDALASGEASLAKDMEAAVARKADLDGRTQELTEERSALEALAQDVDRRQQALDAQLADVTSREETLAMRIKDLEALKNHLGPRERAVLEKEKELGAQADGLAGRETRLQTQTDLVAAKALEIQQAMETVEQKEEGMARDRAVLNEARAALEAGQKEFQSTEAAFQRELESRRDELDAQGRALGEQQLRLARERDDFEAHRADKSQWIASKDIELEAREQSLMEKEAAVRAQAEENARALADLAAREENLEIESSKMDKTRAELEAKKTELTATSRDLEAKTARNRDEEARKAEELRIWQSTLESEQSLLKEQRERFEAEMAEVRESWAGRMLRVEQREAELEERETKVQSDVDWVARNETEIANRQKGADETLKTANSLKAEAERLHKELAQRAMEVESRERSVREDAANFSIELQKRTEAIAAGEADLAGRKAQTDRELTTRTQRLQEKESDLAQRAQSLDAKLADLEGRELKLASMQDSLREEGDRIAREHSDLQALAQQIEGKQLQLAQTKERQEAEANRLREEADAMHQSLAAKEADLRSERDRLERESSSLQDKLGAKAQEMAAREKGLNAREDELRSEEQDFESRVREIDSRDRQLQAHSAEIQTQAQTLTQREKEVTARSAHFDETVHKFEAEAAAKRREWEDLQATLKSQEARIAATAETRQSEIAKRMEDLDHRERSVNATMTQLQIERSRLDAQAKALSGKETEVAGSLGRSEKRFSDLKAMEEELLKSRQAFESERAAWAGRRSDELRQLEATRDAAAEQTQQTERLIEESQRRAFVASEAEKAAKRQADDLAARQAQLEARRSEAEKSERDLQAQMAQFTELSQKIATRENDLAARIRELESRQGKLSAAEQANAAAADELKGRKASLDQEAARLATVTAEAERRRAQDNTRHASVEAKLEEVAKRDQQLATELQRADNLMEDLARKEAAIQAQEKGFASQETELARREAALVERSKELMEGMASLEKMKKDHAAMVGRTEDEHRVAASAREEAERLKAEADKMKTQSDAMQAEVSKNMRFLQKKALDVLDREEKIRVREVKSEEENRALEMRTQIVEGKEKTLDVERDDLISKMEKIKADNEKLRVRLADQEKAQKPMVDMEEWKRDIDNRVKIIQRKALELLDREEKLRKREEDLKALAEQLGVKP